MIYINRSKLLGKSKLYQLISALLKRLLEMSVTMIDAPRMSFDCICFKFLNCAKMQITAKQRSSIMKVKLT